MNKLFGPPTICAHSAERKYRGKLYLSERAGSETPPPEMRRRAGHDRVIIERADAWIHGKLPSMR